jgi:colanic acid biosynthesis glycosyl transferase WcaI
LRFGLLTQWYDPEPGPAALPGVLARGLRARGHDVQVVTGFPNYPSGELAAGYKLKTKQDEWAEDVQVRRVALYPSHDNHAVRRIANYASFGVSATVFGLGALRGLDAIWVYCSPITVAWPMWAARYALGIPAVIHVMDLWPDTVQAGGFASEGAAYRAVARPLNAWCRAMYRAANAVAYISPGVGARLRDRGVPVAKLYYVPLWADETIFQPSSDHLRADLGLNDDHIVLLYAGALGEAQALHSLIEACADIKDPRFVALIAGSGGSETSLRQRAVDLQTKNVHFLGRVPQSDMTRLMATADISYIALRTHALSTVTMPSKTQAALAAGRAMLIAAEGDIRRMGAESGAALFAHPDHASNIEAAIKEGCALGRRALADSGHWGLRYYEETFSTIGAS